ncbi:MAG: response regulator [Bdellovibrionales bacterium]|nr:response regulator [Bdellovibrionales bacterium]
MDSNFPSDETKSENEVEDLVETFRRTKKFRNEVVLIEDSEEDRMIMKMILEGCGYRPREIKDARKVTAVVGGQKMGWVPEAFIIDLVLEGSSGYEVIRNLKPRFEGKRVPMIVVSSLATDEDIYEASTAGADAFVKKPFTPNQLLEALAFTLENIKKPMADRKLAIYVKR